MKKLPEVVSVTAHADYSLTVTFANGEVRQFDVHQYLDRGPIWQGARPRKYAKQNIKGR